jgi:hypothetical protein
MPKKNQLPETNIITPDNIFFNTISNYELYSPAYLKVQTKKGFLVPFKLNGIQHLMERIVLDTLDHGRLIRFVVLKARREGISTWVSGRYFWRTTTNANRYAMIITHEPEATDFVFGMHKRFYKHLPHELQPEERYNNKKMLEFNNEIGNGLDSAVRVGTAGKEDLGSSQLIHYLHLSELAKYPRHLCTNLLLSLFQCVPAIPDSAIIMESTAKGVGGEFYDRYWDSRYRYIFYLDEAGQPQFRVEINELAPENNEFASIFIPWFVFDEYQMQPKDGFKRSEEEDELAKKHGLTDARLQWRRWCLENQCNGKLDLFNQEYPTMDMDAFISGSNNLFDIKQLTELIHAAIPPRTRYALQPGLHNWITDANGALKVWKEPLQGRFYTIGGDVSEGVTKGDFACLDVIDNSTSEQVAQWHGKVAPDQLAVIAFQLGVRYNNAVLAIERNDPGRSVIDKLMYLNYRNLYVERIIDPPNRPRKRYGWLTTQKSKPLVINNLIAEMREGIDDTGRHGVYCKESLQEMMFFKEFEDGSMGAESGRKDDRVMSLAIGKYIASKNRRPKLALGNKTAYNQSRGESTSVSPKGWT